VLLYAESASANQPLERQVFSELWTGASAQGVAPADVSRFVVRASPTTDELAALVQCIDGTLELRRYDSGVWFGGVTVAFDVGSPTLDVAHAAFESTSGRVVMGYRKGSDTLVYISTHDGTLSAESWVDLGLLSAPLRVGLFASPSSDEVLVVASDGATLAAGVWDGTTVGNVITLDSSYTPGHWAAVYETGSGRSMIAWARSGDASFRTRVFSSGAWSSEGSGPAVGGLIDSIALAADPNASANSIAVVVGCDSGSPAQLYASDWNGANWSVAQQLSGSLSNTGAFAVAFEPEGGAAIATWQDTGRDDLYASRWGGSAWSAAAASGTFSDGVVQIESVGRDSGGAVIALARSRAVSGDPYTDYVVYSDGGGLSIGGVTVNGNSGTNDPGVDLPTPPSASPGSPDLSYGNNKDETIAPGAYGTLSVGNNCTLRFQAGTYVFETFVVEAFNSTSNSTELIFDTSGGDVEFIITSGDFHAKNSMIMNPTGAGVVMFHVLNGDFISGSGATIEAAVFVYNGDITLGNNASVVGHLMASGTITIGGGTVSLPGWLIPGGNYVVTQSLHAFTITDGLPGSGTTITSAWGGSADLPFAISRIPPTSGGVTIVRWREIDPDQ